MADIQIYTTRYCPFCVRAKQILDAKGTGYTEIPVDGDPALRAKMTEKAGQHTVPQIWINDQHVGGCTDLMQLDAMGQLDKMLAA
ncbi:Glutaredoxin 3 [BD1-7 clade bacterium]|uniref:Glutaredoxin n=1 Tax=BD1-7 clade bacterium TaxID=2029982 RepID=A0A5S9MZK6_9GAMM|nr:Glutaredoxin 3 [BD1-7 clade bacterium]CAA0082148.1 Glutaredoxin 3 [BD1-7 clade bacterium]CAA0085463.1 Glutaredoxin 3 [BD1-7 clade bacterium]